MPPVRQERGEGMTALLARGVKCRDSGSRSSRRRDAGEPGVGASENDHAVTVPGTAGQIGPVVSHRGCGGLPVRSTVFTFGTFGPLAEYPMNRLSGDQKNGGGVSVVSLPGSGRTSSESMKRTHTRGTRSGPSAENASLRPSGDSAKFLPAAFDTLGQVDLRADRFLRRRRRAPRRPQRDDQRCRQHRHQGCPSPGPGLPAYCDGRFLDERHRVADVAQPPRRVFFETAAQQRTNACRGTVEIRWPLEHRRQDVRDGVARERPRRR